MNPKEAKHIGIQKALKVTTIGVLLAYLMMVLFTGGDFSWLTEFNYALNIFIGLVILYVCAYFSGQRAGFEILVKNKNPNLVGAKYGILILFITAILAGCAGWVQEGLGANDSLASSFEDYIFKPFFWIMLAGWIPSIILGVLFGRWIKKEKSLSEF